MRITGVEIANYRAFRGDSFKLEFSDGENLLIYGENGSGKSSFYHSIQDFLNAASDTRLKIETNRHRFNVLPSSVRVTLNSRSKPYEWSPAAREQDSTEWRDIDKGKGFLDYRSLFRVHYLTKATDEIDLFDLLIDSLLAHYKNPASSPSRTFREEWNSLKSYFAKYRRRPSNLDTLLGAFNAGFASIVDETAIKASGLAKKFDGDLELAFNFAAAHYDWRPKDLHPPKVTVRPQFRRLPHPDYERFFNEARLSAIAMSIFFAAVKDCPVSGLRLLVLDDIMIGLDMSNRLVVLRLMEELFADWQIIILTYHKAWFEILKERTRSPRWTHGWKSIVLRARRIALDTVPVVDFEDSGLLLQTAANCLGRQDLKAAAVYTRTALEAVLQQYSSKWRLRVRFATDIRQLTTEDFLSVIKSQLDRLVDPALRAEAELLLSEVKLARHFVLNAFAHQNQSMEDELSGEVGEAIQTVKWLESFLLRLKRSDLDDAVRVERASVAQLVILARRLARENRREAAMEALLRAGDSFVRDYLTVKSMFVPFRGEYRRSELWGWAFPKDSLTEKERAQFKMIKPYFLAHTTPKDYDPSRFEKTAEFLIETVYGPLIRIIRFRSEGLDWVPGAG
jgi:energy-coupling factor transporter ATP-binding protein EcfA2